MNTIDHTHDPNATSWVQSANSHPWFPLQNIPMGVADTDNGARIVAAIGDDTLDLRAALDLGYLNELTAKQQNALRQATLNHWMGLDSAARLQIRHALFSLLSTGHAAQADASTLVHKQTDLSMRLPAHIGDFTDYYCGIHHAIKVGQVFRPDNPLLPNYAHMPLAYHGRASSIRPSGVDVVRPAGQILVEGEPRLSLSQQLDFELELGMWVGPGNDLGQSIPITQASDHIAGYSLLNDWSARDIQAWEYRPLGPFQGKNFHATLSPWVVTEHALAPFRAPAMTRFEEHGPAMDYLLNQNDQAQGGLDITLKVFLATLRMRAKEIPSARIARSSTRHLYWTPAQMMVQHTLGGCNLQSGDLIGTGTISTPDDMGNGSLLESTHGGTRAIELPSGEERVFLEDGDEVIFSAVCKRDGYRQIGFGECRARILANTQLT